MIKLKPLITSVNVDAIFINDKYQDESQPLSISENDIKSHQVMIEILTKDDKKIELYFQSLTDLNDFCKAYGIE